MKILLAVDGSDTTRRMLDYVVTAPWASAGDRFIVLHCVAPVPHRAAAFEDVAVVQGFYDEDAESVLGPVRAALAAHGIDAVYLHEIGPAAAGIVGLAERAAVDLIVLGSHGRGTVANAVLGSVATRVLADCTTPALIIR